MSETVAYILIFGGIAMLALILVGIALIEVAGEHRDNVAARIRRHGG